MSTEQFARRIDQILRRLDALEARSAINYQTSTWTPTYTGLTTAGITTYTTQVGGWIRVGRLVTVTGNVIWTAATGTGNALFSLPFTAAAVTSQTFSGSVRVESVTFANSTPQIILNNGQAAFRLISPLTNAAGTFVAVEAAGNVTFTLAYFVD